jgi:hypothetical protein
VPRQARFVRRLVTLAAGVTGVVVAHVVGYALAFTDPSQRARVLHDTGHGYFSIAAWAALAAAGLAMAIVAARGAAHDQDDGDDDRPMRLVPRLGVLTAWQAVLFLAVEISERLAAGVPLHEMARGHEVAIGLAVQVVVAAAIILVLGATAAVSARLAAALRHEPASTRRGTLSPAPPPAAPRALPRTTARSRAPPPSLRPLTAIS